MADFPPLHPGELLREEFMKPLNLTDAFLARAIHVTTPTIGQLMTGQRGITPDMAARLGNAFGMTARFWMNTQADYERETGEDRGSCRT